MSNNQAPIKSEMRQDITLLILSSLLIYAFGVEFGWSAIGLGLTFMLFIRVMVSMGSQIPIIPLMVALSALQWILGPYIDYHNDFDHYKYYMYVKEGAYMSFVVPCVLLFYLGTRFFSTSYSLDDVAQKVERLMHKFPKLPYYLVGVGLVLTYLKLPLPAAFNFILFLLSNIKFIGALYLLYSDNKNRWLIFAGVMSLTLVSSLASGLFHNMLLWLVLTFTFVAHQLRLRLYSRIIAAVVGGVLAIAIQAIKSNFREELPFASGNKFELFTELIKLKWEDGSLFTPDNDNNMTARLNQGWIISAIMHHIPNNEPYANGSTIIEAFKATLLPRFLAPDKKSAGGQENFEKFTGLNLWQGTSMGISLAGEGYANYGRFGGWIFMFCWGLFVSWFWRLLVRKSAVYPTLLMWSPLLFLQVIKAETELVVVLNFLVKASVVVFVLLYVLRKRFNITI